MDDFTNHAVGNVTQLGKKFNWGREKHGEKMMKTLDNRQLLDRLTEQLASYRLPVALGFSQALIQRDTAVSCRNARTDSRGSTWALRREHRGWKWRPLTKTVPSSLQSSIVRTESSRRNRRGTKNILAWIFATGMSPNTHSHRHHVVHCVIHRGSLACVWHRMNVPRMRIHLLHVSRWHHARRFHAVVVMPMMRMVVIHFWDKKSAVINESIHNSIANQFATSSLVLRSTTSFAESSTQAQLEWMPRLITKVAQFHRALEKIRSRLLCKHTSTTSAQFDKSWANEKLSCCRSVLLRTFWSVFGHTSKETNENLDLFNWGPWNLHSKPKKL